MALAIALPLLAQSVYAQGTSGTPEISLVQGNLYRVDAGGRTTVFLVAADGIVLGDPLDRATATWLKDELTRRYPDKVVKYVLHTRRRYDRSEGAQLFMSTAELVGQREFNSELDKARAALEPELAELDGNHDGRLDASELATYPSRELLLSRDRAEDRSVGPDDIYARTQSIKRAFDTQVTLTLSGSTIQMVGAPQPDEPEFSLIYFQDEGVVFTPAIPFSTDTVFVAKGHAVEAALAFTRPLVALNAATILTGSGQTEAVGSVLDFGRYLDALLVAVSSALEQGQSAATAAASPSLDTFRDNLHYAGRNDQARALFRTVHLTKLELQVAAVADYRAGNGSFCAASTACAAGGVVAMVSPALTLWVNRVGFGIEGGFGGETLGSKTTAAQDVEVAHRQSYFSVLGHRALRTNGKVSVRLSAGPAFVVADAKGFSRVHGYAPAGGRKPIDERKTIFGITGGADLTMRLGAVTVLNFPVRAMIVKGASSTTWPSTVDLQVGVGLLWRFNRRVVL